MHRGTEKFNNIKWSEERYVDRREQRLTGLENQEKEIYTQKNRRKVNTWKNCSVTMVSLRAFLLVLILHTTVVVPAASVTLSRLERWVRSALQSLQWNQLERCRRLSSLSEAECRQHAHLPLSSLAVYVAEPHSVAGSSTLLFCYSQCSVCFLWAHRSGGCTHIYS